MAVTDVRAAENTYESSATGGTIPAANKKIYVASWVKRQEPMETPLVSSIGYGKAINQDIFYFGQSYRLPLSAATAEDLDTSEAGVDVASGQGTRFHVNDVIAVIDYFATTTRTDESTKEIMWVTAISTDTLTVLRQQGSTSAVAHTSGALVEIIGVAEPQNQDHVLTPQRRGDQKYNYFQRFAEMAQADDAARHQPTYENETDILLADLAEATVRAKLLLEKSIIRGGRQRGQPGSTVSPSMMGGLDTFITTNVTNAGGAALSVYSLEAEVRDLWKSVGENRATKLLMSADTATIFDSLLNPYRRADMSTTTANLMWNSVKFRFAEFQFAVSRWIPDGVIYGVRLDKMSIIPFAGMDWHTKDLVTQGDHSAKSISGDFSFKLEAEHTMFKLWNFDTDLSNYPRQYL